MVFKKYLVGKMSPSGEYMFSFFSVKCRNRNIFVVLVCCYFVWVFIWDYFFSPLIQISLINPWQTVQAHF